MRTLLFTALVVFFFGCTAEQKETTTKGNLHIFIPESIAPVMIEEVNAFLSLYKNNGAQITYAIVSSESASRRFVSDTARIAFLTCPLTKTEKESVHKISPNYNEMVIAYDGIVVVIHPKNKTIQLTTTEIRKIFNGTIKRWEQLDHAKPMTGVIKIYCQDSSDVIGYLTQRLLKQTETTALFTHTASDIQTLHSVEKDRLSLGFVALNWVDSVRSTAKIINLGRTSEDTDTTFASSENVNNAFYSPHPANIYRNYYPFKRAVYMYTRGNTDLASGFGTYVATAEGQKLIMKHGLLTGTQKIKLRSNQPE
jgi:phosphate transport system substrate-binding protein